MVSINWENVLKISNRGADNIKCMTSSSLLSISSVKDVITCMKQNAFGKKEFYVSTPKLPVKIVTAISKCTRDVAS